MWCICEVVEHGVDFVVSTDAGAGVWIAIWECVVDLWQAESRYVHAACCEVADVAL